ncbi:MAG: GGDEF domain-containing protein [Desulfovibrionaceae bacterium]
MAEKNNTCIDNFRELIDRFGVSEDLDWLAVVLFVRNLVARMTIFTDDLKCDVQREVLQRLSSGGLSDENLATTIEQVEAFILQNEGTLDLQRALNEEKRATVALVDEMNSLFGALRGSNHRNEQRINRFGEQAVAAVETQESKTELIRQVRGMLTELITEFREEARDWEARARSLERTANYDPLLTEMFNRRSFDHRLDDAVVESHSRGTPLSLLMLDVDHFKNVNDECGHQVGDDLLRALAKIVLTHAARFGGYAARYGGEELVVLCEMDEERAAYEAEIIRDDVAHYEFMARKGGKVCATVQFTVSVGVAQLEEDWEPDRLVEAADQALYRAKDAGRNRVETWTGKATD